MRNVHFSRSFLAEAKLELSMALGETVNILSLQSSGGYGLATGLAGGHALPGQGPHDKWISF